MDTLYKNDQCGLGRALQGMVGGTIEHILRITGKGAFVGDRYILKNLEERASPEHIEANLHHFLIQNHFFPSSYQFEGFQALPGGSLKRYLHLHDPARVYQVTLSVPPTRDKVTVDIGIFSKDIQDY